MRRIRVATIEPAASDDRHAEDLVLLAVVVCGIAFAAFVLGAQLQAALGLVL